MEVRFGGELLYSMPGMCCLALLSSASCSSESSCQAAAGLVLQGWLCWWDITIRAAGPQAGREWEETSKRLGETSKRLGKTSQVFISYTQVPWVLLQRVSGQKGSCQGLGMLSGMLSSFPESFFCPPFAGLVLSHPGGFRLSPC